MPLTPYGRGNPPGCPPPGGMPLGPLPGGTSRGWGTQVPPCCARAAGGTVPHALGGPAVMQTNGAQASTTGAMPNTHSPNYAGLALGNTTNTHQAAPMASATKLAWGRAPAASIVSTPTKGLVQAQRLGSLGMGRSHLWCQLGGANGPNQLSPPQALWCWPRLLYGQGVPRGLPPTQCTRKSDPLSTPKSHTHASSPSGGVALATGPGQWHIMAPWPESPGQGHWGRWFGPTRRTEQARREICSHYHPLFDLAILEVIQILQARKETVMTKPERYKERKAEDMDK